MLRIIYNLLFPKHQQRHVQQNMEKPCMYVSKLFEHGNVNLVKDLDGNIVEKQVLPTSYSVDFAIQYADKVKIINCPVSEEDFEFISNSINKIK